ncbi:MAG TPA: hypothetical protein VGV89_10390 [Thermoplasmata archaeon]|nr:hypothetical protein [Thermoplasmata archaeon]
MTARYSHEQIHAWTAKAVRDDNIHLLDEKIGASDVDATVATCARCARAIGLWRTNPAFAVSELRAEYPDW